MDYKIISSGSKGNAVIIGNILVDCGVAFKYLKEYLYDVDILLLTHIHSDHIKESTLKNIVVMFPNIRIFGNYEVCQVFNEYPITVVNEEIPFYALDHIAPGMGRIVPFKCLHDVLCYGFVWEFQGNRIIYATDTSDLRNAPELTYDYFFIESNHDEKKVAQLISQRNKFGYNAYAGAKRHMSTQTAKGFYYMHRESADSKFIELHKSSRFY